MYTGPPPSPPLEPPSPAPKLIGRPVERAPVPVERAPSPAPVRQRESPARERSSVPEEHVRIIEVEVKAQHCSRLFLVHMPCPHGRCTDEFMLCIQVQVPVEKVSGMLLFFLRCTL